MQRIWGLDLVRAIAITGVLLSHLPAHTGQNFLQKLFPIGPVFGVELFFVLSGFLIGQILVRAVKTQDFTSKVAFHFIKRRWFRTLPNYYLFLLIMLYLQWNVGKNHVQDFLFFTQNLLSPPVVGFYGVTWSLTIEEIFYIAFPIFLLIVRSITKDPDFKLALAILAFVLFPLALRIIYFGDGLAPQGHYRQAALMRLDAIAYGVLMAFIKIRFTSTWKILQKQGAAMIVPFWYFFLFNQFPKFSVADWPIIYFPLVSISMALMLPYFDSIKDYKGVLSKPVSFIARISYSLYLCHIPVIIVSNQYLGIKTVLSSYYLELFYIVTSVAVAYLVHVSWERPMTNLRRLF